MSEQERPLTLEEAAAYLNISERYMRRLVAERRVAFHKIGRLLRFRTGDLDQMLDRCRIEPATRPLLRRGHRWNPRLAEERQRRLRDGEFLEEKRADG